jgi:type I restriction enzyme S subunit
MKEAKTNSPTGWIFSTLGELTNIEMGQSPPGASTNNDGVGIPLVGGAANFENGDLKMSKYTTSPTKISTKGDLILCIRATLGKAAFADGEYCLGRGVAGIRIRVLEPLWIMHFVRASQALISSLGTGTTFKQIDKKKLSNFPIPLAPLNEQKRIVVRIEELQARRRRAKEALEAIPDLLEQLRQSILAAAVSGRLTEDWRETSTDENTNTPMRHQEGNDSEDIQFPEYWKTYSVGDVLTLIDGDRGPNYPKQDDYKDSGHCLFLSTKNVRKYGFLFDEVVFLTEEKHKILRNGTLERGDVIITTRGTLGNVAVYDEKVPYNVVRINSGMLILRKKVIDLLSDFIRIYIASPYFIEQLNEKRTGSAQPQIPAGILKSFTINVPPLAEQHEIVKRVEELFKIVDQIEERYSQVKKHLNTIDQSILSKAFRGKLVPQDPTDESASILLERIRQEKAREAAQPKVKDKRKGKKMKRKQCDAGLPFIRIRQTVSAKSEPSSLLADTSPHGKETRG